MSWFGDEIRFKNVYLFMWKISFVQTNGGIFAGWMCSPESNLTVFTPSPNLFDFALTRHLKSNKKQKKKKNEKNAFVYENEIELLFICI